MLVVALVKNVGELTAPGASVVLRVDPDLMEFIVDWKMPSVVLDSDDSEHVQLGPQVFTGLLLRNERT